MKTLIFLTLICTFLSGELTFVTNPSIVKRGSNWQVTFTLSEATDVEVYIIDLRDSSIVRHLAAGVLGSNAPAPLTPNSLVQTITWNGLDDLGKTVTIPDNSITVRVRAGMNVKLDCIAGGSPYAFRGPGVGNHSFNGLTTDPNGFLYVYGSSGSLSEMTIRKYDGSGNYLKTLYPYPAGMPLSDVSLYGINIWSNGKYSPRATKISNPILSALPVANSGSFLLSASSSGELCIGKLDQFILKTSGAATTLPFKLITSPSYPDDQYFGCGPFYIFNPKDTNIVYLSGYYTGVIANGHLQSAPDTGFWRDGGVFKIDRKTGVATRFITIDSVPVTLAARTVNIGPDRAFSATHGMAEDSKGRLYVCNRHLRQIGVYDQSGVLLGGIKVDFPENVSVNPTTGEVYVATRYQSSSWHVGLLKLYKFASFDNGGAPLCSLTLTTATGDYSKDRPSMGLGFSSEGVTVWVGFITFGVRGYRDNGSSFSLIKDFYEENNGINIGFDRVVVDRKTETVFVGDSWNRIYKITDWNNPFLKPCSTFAKQPLLAVEMTISPDRKLYVREDRLPIKGGGWSGPVTRFSLDYYHVPLPYANTSSNEIVPITERYGAGYAGRDIAVSAQGKIGFITERTFGEFVVGTCDDTGNSFESSARFLMPQVLDTVVYPITGSYSVAAGIRFDGAGNIYVGSNLRTADHTVPAGFESCPGYNEAVGSVIKYSAGTRGSISGSTPPTRTASGAEKVYKTGLAPFSGIPGHTCICRNPHFDVDMFGRIFIPNAITNKVTVVDNNGNEIVSFGDYGNIDSKGPGSLVPDPAIPLAWPVGVASSDDFVYITDMINSRLIRVMMKHTLDNIPAMNPTKSETNQLAVNQIAISASPNPFTPFTTLRIDLPLTSVVSLTVVDIAGRTIKSIANGTLTKGSHAFIWNGTDSKGANVSAGMYIIRLKTQDVVLNAKVFLSR